jgi:hypothetical protein
VDNCRKAVDNPAALRASLGRWGGWIHIVQPPQDFIQTILLIQILVEEIHDLKLTQLFSFSLCCHKHKHECFRQTYAN